MGMKQPRFSWIVPGQNWQLDHETAVGNLCFQAEFVDFEFVATKFPQKKVTTVWYIPVSWNKLTRDWFKFTYFILFLVVISKTNFFFSLQTLLGDVQTLGHFFKKNSGCWRVPPHRFASWETSRGWGSSVFTITQQVEGLERGKVFFGVLNNAVVVVVVVLPRCWVTLSSLWA